MQLHHRLEKRMQKLSLSARNAPSLCLPGNRPSQEPAKVQSTYNYHLCGLSWEGSSATANPHGRFQIQARSLIVARKASRWRSALRLWGLWDSGSPSLALFCSLATIPTTSAPTVRRCNSIAIKTGMPGNPHSLMRRIKPCTDQALIVPARVALRLSCVRNWLSVG